jgi:hypothetical protein
MALKQIGWFSILTVVLFLTPLLARAQVQIQLPPHWPPFPNEQRPAPPEHFSDEPRGLLEVINDWQDNVQVTVWSNQRERIGEWSIPPGQTVNFAQEGQRIKVRPHYKIKVGEDWGWVDVGQVGEFHNGVWFVRIRDIWRATHGARQRDRAEVPDWRR